MAEHTETRAELRRNGGSKPVPDPTEMTIQVMEREIKSLRELLLQRVDGDKAVAGEKFRNIDMQFTERDQRVVASRAADAAALSAALQAAKEAVGEANKAFSLSIEKSEKSTTKQIEQGAEVATTNFRAITDKIDAIDKRVTRSEGQGQGQGQLWGYIVGAVGLLGAVIAIFITLATRVP